MFTANAYTHLQSLTGPVSVSETYFDKLVIYFRETILAETDLRARLRRHRKPVYLLEEIRQTLNQHIQKIQDRPEMRHIDVLGFGYVPSHIKWLWEEDRSLGTLYNTVSEFCRIHGYSLLVVAVHMAEYRATNKLASKVSRMIRRLEKGG